MMCFSCRVTSDAKVVFLDVIPTPQNIISDFSYICLLLTIKFEYRYRGGSRREKENRREGTLERKCPPFRK